jgi:hypothetical protein
MSVGVSTRTFDQMGQREGDLGLAIRGMGRITKIAKRRKGLWHKTGPKEVRAII